MKAAEPVAAKPEGAAPKRATRKKKTDGEEVKPREASNWDRKYTQ